MKISSGNQINRLTSIFWYSFIVLLLSTGCSRKKSRNRTVEKAPSTVVTGSNKETAPVKPTPTPENLILTESELDNAKLDRKWSGTSSNGLSNTYRKKINSSTERSVILELYQFADTLAAQAKYKEDMESYFSKTRPDGDGGKERNPFYSQRINIEKIGDASFCYKFVSPTVEVLFKNYIIECNVTIDYTYENLSEHNSATLKKSKDIILKQIEKIIQNTTNQ